MGWVILFLLNRVYQSPILLSLYKWFKFIYGQISYTTEISRLLYTPLSPFKLYRIDKSISYSNVLMEENFQLKESICDIDSIKGSITQKKRVPVDLHVNLLNALQVIYASNQLLNSINDSISTKYDSNNKEHEDKLLQLWNKLMPNKSLQSRITKQWIDIGFQGNDPATDFRGMGIQGLDDLLFFAEHYPAHARSILEHANDPLQWYPFAIVGINITKFNYQLVESKKLQLYLFEYGTDERAFQEFYCYLFYKFDQFWMFTVMEFESRFNEFKFIVEKELMQQKVKPFSMLIQDNLQIYKDDKKLN